MWDVCGRKQMQKSVKENYMQKESKLVLRFITAKLIYFTQILGYNV